MPTYFIHVFEKNQVPRAALVPMIFAICLTGFGWTTVLQLLSWCLCIIKSMSNDVNLAVRHPCRVELQSKFNSSQTTHHNKHLSTSLSQHLNQMSFTVYLHKSTLENPVSTAENTDKLTLTKDPNFEETDEGVNIESLAGMLDDLVNDETLPRLSELDVAFEMDEVEIEEEEPWDDNDKISSITLLMEGLRRSSRNTKKMDYDDKLTPPYRENQPRNEFVLVSEKE